MDGSSSGEGACKHTGTWTSGLAPLRLYNFQPGQPHHWLKSHGAEAAVLQDLKRKDTEKRLLVSLKNRELPVLSIKSHSTPLVVLGLSPHLGMPPPPSRPALIRVSDSPYDSRASDHPSGVSMDLIFLKLQFVKFLCASRTIIICHRGQEGIWME